MKVLDDVLCIFESEMDGLNFGEVCLTVFLRDGKFRYAIRRERSLIPETDHQTGRANDGKNIR